MSIRHLWIGIIALGFVGSQVRAQSCIPAPEAWLSARLLADLPITTQVERQAAVDATLAANPGAVEVFLSSLMSWPFLLTHRGDIATRGSGASFARGNTFNNRGFGYMAGLRTPLDVGGTTYGIEGQVFTSPLILDLDADGAPDVAGGQWQPRVGMNLAGPLVPFDWNGDGFGEVTEWIRSDDALLVAPSDPSSVVATPLGLEWSGPISGRDLLGSIDGFSTGFDKLFFNWDDDADGIVTGPELDGLYIWWDTDEDGVVDTGELYLPGDLDVTALHAPMPGTCAGSFTRAGFVEAMWDWWPSYLRAHVAAAGAVPASVALAPVALPNTSYLGPALAVAADHRIARATLDAAGFPVGGRLLTVSPDHTRAFVLDGTRSQDDGVIRVWILPLAEFGGGAVVPRIVPLPAVELVQFAFESEDSAILVTDDGSSILRLDVASGALTRLLAPGGGFRCSNLAIALPDGGVAVSGSFHDAARGEGDEVLALVGPSSLTQVANLDDLQDAASSLGTLAGLLVQSPTRAYAVVRPPGGAGQLVHFESGTPTVIANDVSPVGLAAHGNRVMYFQEIPPTSKLRACIFDVALATTFVLGQDDWNYPYLDRAGSRPLTAGINWSVSTMTIRSAPTGNGVTFDPVLTSGIGAVRYSEDGGAIACLAAEGLYVLEQAPTGVLAEPAPASRRVHNVPNPFNPSTTIHFDLPSPEHVRVDVFDARGRLVATPVDAARDAGVHTIRWSGTDARGRPLPSGNYVYRLTAGSRLYDGKMTLVR